MLIMRRLTAFSLLVCFTAGLMALAKGDDDDEPREALKDGQCSIQAIVAVEAADAREGFEDFEREVMRAGLVGNHFQNPEVVEQRIGRHLFSPKLSAYQMMFVYLTKRDLEKREGPVSGHSILAEMREHFGEPLAKNPAFPFLSAIGIDSSLTWNDSQTFFRRSFSYLEKPGMGGHGLHRLNDGTIFAVARIEDELYLYLYQPGYAGPRKGRLGVFEWRKPNRPVGRPEHVGVFAKYFQDREVSILPER